MMNWDEETTLKFVNLLRENEVIVEFLRIPASKHNDKQIITKFHDALEDVGKSIKPYLTIPEVLKKIHHLRDVYSDEIRKVRRDPRYKPNIKWFQEIREIFNNKIKQLKGAQPDHNTDGGENSNQSFSNGLDETRTESEDIADLPTQLNNYQERYSIALAVPATTSNVPSIHLPADNSLVREDQFQIPDISEHSIPNNEMEVSHDDASEGVDLPTGGMDETLTSFGNYLISLLRRLPLDKSYQLQQKFISETINTTVRLEKERALNKEQSKKRKRDVTPVYNRFHPLRQEHSTGDSPSNRRIPNSNHGSTCLSSKSQGPGQALPNRANTSGGTHALDDVHGGPEITFEKGTESASEVSSNEKRDNQILQAITCVECSMCKELFRTSTELKIHFFTKHSDARKES